MSSNTWFALVFFTIFLGVSLWKWWAWLLWKYLDLRKDKQVFELIGKNRFIEITGPAGKGKSWLLCHLFKHLNGVKFTNMPTSQGLYTLTKENFEVHMIGCWAAPNRWYYFLDDIEKFQKWSKKQFGHHGYKELREYFAQASKIGGTFIWTNNGVEPEHLFKTQKNETWKVLWYASFMNYSLLVVKKGYWITLIPINNKEIESFYDPHWNIPKLYHRNLLNYIANREKAGELKEILRVVETGDTSGKAQLIKTVGQDTYKMLEKHIKFREIEEAVARKKKLKISELANKLKRYGLATTPIDREELARLDKLDKKNKSPQTSNPQSKLKKVVSEYEEENGIPPLVKEQITDEELGDSSPVKPKKKSYDQKKTSKKTPKKKS